MQPVTTFVPQGMRVSTFCRYRRECDRLGNGCLSARRCNTTTWVALSVILLLRVTFSLRAIVLLRVAFSLLAILLLRVALSLPAILLLRVAFSLRAIVLLRVAFSLRAIVLLRVGFSLRAIVLLRVGFSLLAILLLRVALSLPAILLLRVTLSLRAILLVDTVTVLPVIEIWIGSAFSDPRIHALCSLNRYGLPAWIGIGLAFGAVGWMHKWCSLERRLPAGFEKFLVGSTVG